MNFDTKLKRVSANITSVFTSSPSLMDELGERGHMCVCVCVCVLPPMHIAAMNKHSSYWYILLKVRFRNLNTLTLNTFAFS